MKFFALSICYASQPPKMSMPPPGLEWSSRNLLDMTGIEKLRAGRSPVEDIPQSWISSSMVPGSSSRAWSPSSMVPSPDRSPRAWSPSHLTEQARVVVSSKYPQLDAQPSAIITTGEPAYNLDIWLTTGSNEPWAPSNEVSPHAWSPSHRSPPMVRARTRGPAVSQISTKEVPSESVLSALTMDKAARLSPKARSWSPENVFQLEMPGPPSDVVKPIASFQSSQVLNKAFLTLASSVANLEDAEKRLGAAHFRLIDAHHRFDTLQQFMERLPLPASPMLVPKALYDASFDQNSKYSLEMVRNVAAAAPHVVGPIIEALIVHIGNVNSLFGPQLTFRTCLEAHKFMGSYFSDLEGRVTALTHVVETIDGEVARARAAVANAQTNS